MEVATVSEANGPSSIGSTPSQPVFAANTLVRSNVAVEGVEAGNERSE